MNCPTCRKPMRNEANGNAWACYPCQYITIPNHADAVTISAPEVQLKLPGLQPGPQRRKIVRKEEDVQGDIIRALEIAGYRTLSTVHRHKKFRCRECGAWQWPSGGLGTTPGVPDLIVCVPGGIIGLEVKGTRTAVSKEQRELAEAGHIRIVRSVEEALNVVMMFGRGGQTA